MTREMKDSGIEWIGQIPKEWLVLRNKYNFISHKDIIGSDFKNTQLLSLTKNGIKKISPDEQSGKVPTSYDTYQKVKTNDLVMCLFDLDVSAVFSGISKYDGMISPAYRCFNCKEHLIPEYAGYYFETVFVDRKYKRYSKNVRYSLNEDEFLNLPILIPSIKTQISIVRFLNSKGSQIDSILTSLQDQIDTLEQYKKSVITEAVTKGLNPDAEMKDSGIDYIGKYPSTWKLKRLKYTITERNERSSTGNEELLSVSQYKGVIPSSENANRTMQANTLIGYKKVFIDDLVFNKLNPVLARFGKSEYEGITSPDYAVYIVDHNVYFTKFLEYILKTDRYSKEYGRVTLGVGDGYTRLYTNQLGCFYVATPSIEEQKKILSYLDEKCKTIENIIEDKQQQFKILEQYKKSLIYEYVTGKREVPNA